MLWIAVIYSIVWCYNLAMFGNSLIGFLLAAGFGTWVYTKMMRKTGSNTKQAVTTALIAAGAIFLLTLSLLGFIPEN